MKKSVGPVGAMSYPDEVWGRSKQGKAGVWWGKRGEVPRISEDLAFCTAKNGQKQQDFRGWESNLQPLGYKPSALATELSSSKAIAGKELSLSSWCLTAISFELFNSMARASVITKGLRVRVSPSASSLYISLLVLGVPVPSRTTVLLG